VAIIAQAEAACKRGTRRRIETEAGADPEALRLRQKEQETTGTHGSGRRYLYQCGGQTRHRRRRRIRGGLCFPLALCGYSWSKRGIVRHGGRFSSATQSNSIGHGGQRQRLRLPLSLPKIRGKGTVTSEGAQRGGQRRAVGLVIAGKSSISFRCRRRDGGGCLGGSGGAAPPAELAAAGKENSLII